jgi:hypothetical protein
LGRGRHARVVLLPKHATGTRGDVGDRPGQPRLRVDAFDAPSWSDTPKVGNHPRQQGEPMKHLVQFSTGAGSAEVAWRVVDKYGPNDVVLLTADTLVEDEDNWRFAREVVDRLGCEWIVLAHGMTPMQIGRKERCVPNNRWAVCSKILKRELLRDYMDTHYDPTDSIVYLGFDWTAPERHEKSLIPWAPWRVESPLLQPPYVSKPDLLDVFRSRGIEPPRLYAKGFSHANCGGACVRGGQAQWQRVLTVNRPPYLEWEAEEQASRDMLGKDVSILRDRRGGVTTPLPLRGFRERLKCQPTLFDTDDWGGCGCKFEDEQP